MTPSAHVGIEGLAMARIIHPNTPTLAAALGTLFPSMGERLNASQSSPSPGFSVTVEGPTLTRSAQTTKRRTPSATKPQAKPAWATQYCWLCGRMMRDLTLKETLARPLWCVLCLKRHTPWPEPCKGCDGQIHPKE